MNDYGNPYNRYQPPRIPVGHGPSSLAWATFVFGFGSWIALPLAGAAAAVICGMMERRKILEGTSSPEGHNLVLLGMVMGAAQLALVAFFMAGFILFFALVMLAAVMA